jgi:hypothetical protein
VVNIRGLRTRLCTECREITPQRTLYVKTRTEGRLKWLQIFWACAKCNSPNHIILPAYRVESAAAPLPSSLTIGIVNTLCAGPLDIDELIMTLRKDRPRGVSHIFNSEVLLALEFLKGHGVVKEESSDRTARVLELIRAKPRRTGRGDICPRNSFHHDARSRSLVSLYAQKSNEASNATRLVSVGVLCRDCLYVRLD